MRPVSPASSTRSIASPMPPVRRSRKPRPQTPRACATPSASTNLAPYGRASNSIFAISQVDRSSYQRLPPTYLNVGSSADPPINWRSHGGQLRVDLTRLASHTPTAGNGATSPSARVSRKGRKPPENEPALAGGQRRGRSILGSGGEA